MLPKNICFVDLETTGARSQFDRIIEIGILRVEDGEIVQTYKSLINPQISHIPPEITALTGISYADLEDAPTFREVHKDVLEILADSVFVAHNVRFDYGFMKSELKRLEIDYTSRHFCTVKLSRSLFPEFAHHNLDAIMQRYNFTCEHRHRAFDDAEVLFKFYTALQKQVPLEKLLSAVNLAMRKPSLPLKINQTDLDALPETPGVYIFYGEDGIPLYVGKSVNIKERVLSHFSADVHSGTEMKISQQIESIETIKTAGELGALFLESGMIKKMLPLYNKQLRLKKELIAVRKGTNDHGYHTVRLESITQVDPTQMDSFVGFFSSRKQAKQFLSMVAKEHQLCEKLLELEHTNKDCFGYRLERCKGACIGKELPIRYNMRFIMAFSKTKIKSWPFTGPILIKEQNDLVGLSEYYLIDRWCYMGHIKIDNTNSQQVSLQQREFDHDLYKILLRFFRVPNNLKHIRTLTSKEMASLLSDQTTATIKFMENIDTNFTKQTQLSFDSYFTP